MQKYKMTQSWIGTTLFLLYFFLYAIGMANAQSGETLQEPIDPLEYSEKLFGHRRPLSQETLSIGSQEYAKSQVLLDFLNVAFDTNLAYAHTPSPEKSISIFSNEYPQVLLGPSELRQTYLTAMPWAVEYIFRDKGVPRFNAINKWTHDVTVGIGWPRGGSWDNVRADSYRHFHKVYPFIQTDIYPIIRDQVEKIAPAVAEATGLHLRFVDPSEENKETGQSASLRIVPRGVGENEYFKWSDEHISSGGDILFAKAFAVTRFTANFPNQVEGYFISDSVNEIQFSVCHIFPFQQHEELLRSLVSECIIRSLGFPGVSALTDQALLGSWNNGVSASVTKAEAKKASREDRYFQTLEEAFAQSTEAKQKLSDYDFFMMRLLYCPEIQPGEDKYSIIRLFNENSKICINHKGEK